MGKVKLLVIIFVMIICMCLSSTVVLAKAGGGTSGGGHGGGHSGGHSTSGGGHGRGRSSFNDSSPMNDIIVSVVFIGVIINSYKGEFIKKKLYIFNKRSQAKYVISTINNMGENWHYKKFKKRVSEAFYIIQDSWSQRSEYLAKEYMSKELYEKHKGKIDWMIIKHQKNIMKKIKLISIVPISIENLKENNSDTGSIWIYMYGSMIDYIIDDRTMSIIEGQKRKVPFSEYWRFDLQDGNWVLGEIRQDDEMDNENSEFDQY